MTIHWIERDQLWPAVRSAIRPVDVVLDVGCGIRPQRFFTPRLNLLCEPFGEYVQVLQARFAYDMSVFILQGTWQEVMRLLADRSVDTVFVNDVIEHLEKEDGRALLKECERVAREQIAVFTPLGFMAQDFEAGEPDVWGLGGGSWHVHRSGWSPEDFGDAWEIWASRAFHAVDGKGQPLDPPQGAFWVIQDCDRSRSRRDRRRERRARRAKRFTGFLKRHLPGSVYGPLRGIVLRLMGRKP